MDRIKETLTLPVAGFARYIAFGVIACFARYIAFGVIACFARYIAFGVINCFAILKGRKNYFIKFIKLYARLRQLRYPPATNFFEIWAGGKRIPGIEEINTLLIYCDNFDVY